MSCCQDKACEVETLQREQSRILWAVLGINGTMFGLELTVGFLAGSVALLADSLDMLGDTLVYGFSLFVVAKSARWRTRAALLKGGIMATFGLIVLGQASYRLLVPTVPESYLMGAMGLLALVANATCLYLLTRHKNDDLNMRSTWLCSRNDIVANVGVIAAAALVFVTHTPWPDLIVSLLIMAVFLQSAVYVLRQAWTELRGRCRAGTCPVHACNCALG